MTKKTNPRELFTDEHYLKYGHDPAQGAAKAAARELMALVEESERNRLLREARRRTPKTNPRELFTAEHYEKYGHDPAQGAAKAAARELMALVEESERNRLLREASRRTPRPQLPKPRLH
jgi:hypothetical protein